jgi:hypothetical protein
VQPKKMEHEEGGGFNRLEAREGSEARETAAGVSDASSNGTLAWCTAENTGGKEADEWTHVCYRVIL